MHSEHLLYAFQDGVATITLNRPDRLNALTVPMMKEFSAALDIARQQAGLRVLVLTGAGRGFCAGADLASGITEPGSADIGLVLEQHYNPLIEKIRSMPLPVVAQVNGVAAGAGASLALAADLAIAAHSARFVLAFARIGLVPDAGATYFLIERIGMARALGLALLGEEVGAVEAEAMGLIWRAVPDHDLAATCAALVQRLAQAPTEALALTKQALYAARGHQLAEQLGLERRFQAQLGYTHDFKEGVAAFREKRVARFVGR